LILFLYYLGLLHELLFSCQGSISPLTGDRCAPLSVKRIDYPSNFQLSTMRPGSSPGLILSLAILACYIFYLSLFLIAKIFLVTN
jgi:hypothetical protein